jgi:hypothetical protein
MSHESDYSALDRPEILSIIFYPRRDFSRAPAQPNVADHIIPVGDGVEIGYRFYTAGRDNPTILYFHGNGEIVSEHDGLAPYYNRIGANLFVADYRGYGLSTGRPTISTMLNDAHTIYQSLVHLLEHQGYGGGVYLMGRSLGSASVVEIAYHHQEKIEGLIIESGFADAVRLMQLVGALYDDAAAPGFSEFSNLNKISAIKIPTLIIHGDRDMIVPVENGEALHRQSGAARKRLLVIKGGDHNDILYRGMDEYFAAIKEFIHGD